MKNRVTVICTRMRLRDDISIAELFGVGASFVKKMLRPHRDVKSLASHDRDGAARPLNEEQLEVLQAAIEICPNATIEDLQRFIADECKVTVSQTSISRALKNRRD